MAHENATPRPWFRDASFESGGYIRAEDNTLVVSCMHAYGREPVPARANAALIVEAVNAYDTLRAKNERLREALGDAKWTLGSIANAVRLGGYAQACVAADAGRSRVSAALSEPAQ